MEARCQKSFQNHIQQKFDIITNTPLQNAQMSEISTMKMQFSADMNIIASCASSGFDSINFRVVEMSDILQRVVTLLTMK